MKILISILLIALLPFFAFAGAPNHSEMGHSKMGHKEMGHADHAKMVTLKKAKKPSRKSKKGHFLLTLPEIPTAPGLAHLNLALSHADGKPISNQAKLSITQKMPGMEMDLTPVKITPKGAGEYALEVHLPMPGFWKLQVQITDGPVQDQGTLKIILP